MTRRDFVGICGDRRFWQWIRTKSPIAYTLPKDKSKFLSQLFARIDNRNYYPSPPQDYIIANKGHGVIRTIPAFQLEDLCVYYYCARKLEQYIAVNYVSGTYGGFGLSGKLRQVEQQDINQVQNQHEVVEVGDETYVFTELLGYPTLSTLNSRAWFAEWNDFTKKLYFHAAEFQSGYVADLDIANFYDSIQLDSLEYKLRRVVPHRCNDVMYLLMHFLRYWNRHVNFYRQQGAGIPQDVFGECSRILANFYLQSYDKQFSRFCTSLGGKYFRYADDQVIFGSSKADLEIMIAKASSLLMREGLNINQKKVKVMSIAEFRKYYAFKSFLNLAQKSTENIKVEMLRKEIASYLRNGHKLRKSGISVLRRILGVLGKTTLRPSNFRLLKRHLLSSSVLVDNYSLTTEDLNRMFILLTEREKKMFLSILDDNMRRCMYTMYLYELKGFYKAIKKPTRAITSRIAEVRKFYSFKKMAA